MELNDEMRQQDHDERGCCRSDAGGSQRNGMRNLREDGWMKVREGVTTVDEVMRVTQEF